MTTDRIPMTYTPDGSRVWWKVFRDGKRGWFFTDHDGYTRFGGANWRELVERFSAVAANYNMTHGVS